MKILNEPVNCPLPGAAAGELTLRLWGTDNLQSPRVDAYMEYYSLQCDFFSIEQDHIALHNKSEIALVKSHQDVVDVVELLLKPGQTREALAEELRCRFISSQTTDADVEDRKPVDAMVENAINWAARLVTMMEVGKLACAFSHSQPLLWREGALPTFVLRTLLPSGIGSPNIRLEKSFNAMNLERFAGVTVAWTNDLASHLSLREDDTKLLVFHHSSFLKDASHEILPVGLREETLRTLALLFPNDSRGKRRWIRKQHSLHQLDADIFKCHRLRADDRQIEKFHFWRERISILKQVFDEAEPRTLSQWWYDRRKGPQWYTFWVAIAVLVLTVFFGIIQSVEGALQVYKSW